MIKPAFENLPIECWIHPGRVGLAQPTVCLFHAIASIGKELLDAVQELDPADCQAQRVVTFADCSRDQRVGKLKIITAGESERLRVMNVRCGLDTATVEVTAQGLPLLVEAIGSWIAGAEDFGVSPRRSSLNAREFGTLDRESGELWFWGPGYARP